MYDMDVGCSLKDPTASTTVQWDHFHTDIIYAFSQLSQIWGNLCVGNGVSVLPYAHPQLFKVFKHLIYVMHVEPFKLHPTSMSYIYEVFEHLKQLWMGIWQHTHTITTTDVSPDLGECAEIIYYVSVEMIPLCYC
jgi:hypothetical protein